MWHKTDEHLLNAVEKDLSPRIILDVTGKMLDSPDFGDLVFDRLEAGGSRLCFVIGGADGLPSELRPGQSSSQLDTYFSLSKLTFTHVMARVLLAEQVYRASEIRRGSGYHKD